MDQAFEVGGARFCVLTASRGTPDAYGLLDSIASVALISSCTIECSVPTALEVSTTEPVAALHATGRKDASRRLARIESYVLDQIAPASYMVAIRHGKGRVVALGTWKVFLDELAEYPGTQNTVLFKNVVKWLLAQ